MPRRLMLAMLVLAVLDLGAAVPARAGSVHYVATTGSDSNPGTLGAPWQTMQESLRRLRAGDTLYVRGGYYRERIATIGFSEGTASSPVRVVAYPGEKPIIKGVLYVRGADYWTFDGINVVWDPERNTDHEFLLKFMSGIGWSFRNAEVSGARWVGNIFVGSTVAGEPRNWTIAGNCIHDNDATGDPYLTDHNIYLDPGLNSGPGWIERNLIFNSENGYNIKAAGPDSSGGAAKVTIRYNTMAGAAQAVTVAYGSHHIVMDHNLMGPRRGGKSWYPAIRGTKLSGRYNVARGNAATAYDKVVLTTDGSQRIADGGGNRLLDPQFDSISSCNGFHPRNAAAQAYGRWVPELVPGDWDGDRTATPGAFTAGGWHLRNDGSTGPPTARFTYGYAGDTPVVGDWDGDGRDGIGIVRGNTVSLRNTATPGAADTIFTFGASGDRYIAGDWDGDGRDSIGIVRGNLVWLRNSHSAGAPDRSFTYASATDSFVAGDWDGDGRDSIGAVRGATVMLRNQNSTGPAEVTFSYGAATDRFIAGDWDGDRTDTIGIVRSGAWHLRNANSAGGANLVLRFDG